MIKIISQMPLKDPILDEMFLGRALVFHDRLNWDVVLQDGREIDEYDRSESPVYIVSLDDCGRVVGSLRILPTTGPTMLKNDFRSMFQDDVDIDCPTTWECTRFCVHLPDGRQNLAKGAALELLLGLCNLALASGIDTIVGVYEAAMERIYKRLGWSPLLLAKSYPEFGCINCGIWEVSSGVSNILENQIKKLNMTKSIFSNKLSCTLNP